MDAPETNQPYGAQAANRLQSLLPAGTHGRDAVVGGYGSLWANGGGKFFKNQQSVGLQLVAEGYAVGLFRTIFPAARPNEQGYLQAESERAIATQLNFLGPRPIPSYRGTSAEESPPSPLTTSPLRTPLYLACKVTATAAILPPRLRPPPPSGTG